jgi:hypothetical protein
MKDWDLLGKANKAHPEGRLRPVAETVFKVVSWGVTYAEAIFFHGL